MRSYLILLVTLMMVFVSACQPVSAEEATAQFCEDLVDYNTAVTNLGTLTAESTIEEAEAALEAVDEAYDDLVDSGEILADVQFDSLDEAYEDLDDAIRDVESGQPVGDALASLQDEVANVQAAWDELYSVNCQ